MLRLTINQGKPNPAGKDRLGPMVPSAQLAGEWVDFRNSGDESYSLAGIELQHVAYTTAYPNGVWEKVYVFAQSDVLGVGKSVRVHSGGKIDLGMLTPVDSQGVDYHVFSGKGYVWNNDRGDSPRLVRKTGVYQPVEVDKATYSAYPQEGKILIRLGAMLI